jgi:hypothetical protein
MVFFGMKLLHCSNLWQCVKTYVSKLSKIELTVAFLTVLLLSIYALFLSSRAILDSDVVHEYLPIAQEIVKTNGFSYSNGYDYTVQLKPTGVSSLYAWTYCISGSILTEPFRLLPLLPIFMLIVLNYGIARSVTQSKIVALLSTMLFLVFPFHDRFLMNNSFYPDIYYYPLIFAATLFLIKYSRSKLNRYLLFSGMAFGVGSLLKAQTIYFALTFMIMLVLFKLRAFRKLSTLICMLTPFYLLFVNILVNSIQNTGFILWFPSFDGGQVILLLTASLLCGFSYNALITDGILQNFIHNYKLSAFLKASILLLLPLVLLASLQYFINLINFGSLIWTSSANLPNYDWALNVLQSNPIIEHPINVGIYLAYFLFLFTDPAVMGYVLLIPFLVGLFVALRKRQESLFVLFLFTIFFSVIIISKVVISIDPSGSAYNPRDILPMAPLLSIFASIGLLYVLNKLGTKNFGSKPSFKPLLLVTYFGFLSYVHSVYVATVSKLNPTTIGGLMSILSNSVGLNLSQTSFYLSSPDRALFVGENFLKIIALSLLVGFPFLYKDLVGILQSMLNKLRFSNWLKFVHQKNYATFTRALVVLLLFSVIFFPRVELFVVQGNSKDLKNLQLSTTYNELFDLITDNSLLEGDVLTFKAPQGLAYYLPDRRIIDLNYPANLAYLKDVFESNTTSDLVENLTDLGIKHVLVNPSLLSESPYMLYIFDFVRDPEFSELLRSYGSWELYSFRSIEVTKTRISLNNWSVDSTYTNASYVLEPDDTLFLHVNATTIYSRVTLVSRDLPKLNLSDYDYAQIKIEGTDNARTFIRFFFIDDQSIDFSYWENTPHNWKKTIDLFSYNQTLLGEAYISLKSSDGLPASIEIKEICFLSGID